MKSDKIADFYGKNLWRRQSELCKLNKVKEWLGLTSQLFMIWIKY